MTDWSQLTHAYGSAGDVPELMERADTDPASQIWNDLWSRLCHQGTVYPASYTALPELTRLAGQWSPTDRQQPLYLASAIIASTDRPHDVDDPFTTYTAEIADLIRLTEEALHSHRLAAGSSAVYVELLETLLALEGVEVWGDELDGLNTGEYEVPCPRCKSENFIAFGDYGCFSTLDDMYMKNTDTKRNPLLRAEPAALTGLAARLHTRAVADGFPVVANKLTYIFGSAVCADCEGVFNIADAIIDRSAV